MKDYQGRCFDRHGHHRDLGTYTLEQSPAEYARSDRFYGVMLSTWRSFSLDDEQGSVRVRTYYRPLER